MIFLSAGQVADLLQVNTHRLEYLTRDHQIRPLKGPTGAFLWIYQEVTLAAKLLRVPVPSQDDFDNEYSRSFTK